jgi:hypothetical protein
MGQKDLLHGSDVAAGPYELTRYAITAIDDERLTCDLDQLCWLRTVETGPRRPRSEQDDFRSHDPSG